VVSAQYIRDAISVIERVCTEFSKYLGPVTVTESVAREEKGKGVPVLEAILRCFNESLNRCRVARDMLARGRIAQAAYDTIAAAESIRDAINLLKQLVEAKVFSSFARVGFRIPTVQELENLDIQTRLAESYVYEALAGRIGWIEKIERPYSYPQEIEAMKKVATWLASIRNLSDKVIRLFKEVGKRIELRPGYAIEWEVKGGRVEEVASRVVEKRILDETVPIDYWLYRVYEGGNLVGAVLEESWPGETGEVSGNLYVIALKPITIYLPLEDKELTVEPTSVFDILYRIRR